MTLSNISEAYHDAVHELLLLSDRGRQAAAPARPVLHRAHVATVVHVAAAVVVDVVSYYEGGGGNLLTPDGDGDRAQIVI